jgi:hypothetical protein
MKAAAALWNLLTAVLLLLTCTAVGLTAAFFVNPGGVFSGLAVPAPANVELLPTPDLDLLLSATPAQMPTFPPEWTQTYTPSPTASPSLTPTATRTATNTVEPTETEPAGTATRTPRGGVTATRTPGRTATATATRTLAPPTQASSGGGYPDLTFTPPAIATQPPPSYP